MSGLMAGKKGIIFGVANKRSIAWAIAESLKAQGAEIAFTYQNERLKDKVESLLTSWESPLLYQCDATNDSELDDVFNALGEKWGAIDFVVHAIAFANKDELEGDYLKTTEAGFQLALNVSAYTLTSVSRKAKPLLEKSEVGGSIITLSYIGGERVIPGYNVMGVAKSALEMSVRYLANDLGKDNIRVNAISAGPINTLAARGISGFSDILKHVQSKTPLKRNVEASEVGNTALFLCSPLSTGITGETLHVDCGYHVVG